MACDAKFNFDANALFRHPEIVALRDLDEEDPAEVEASKFDLAYISLDGNIGCLVNGAGLAMATMDTIKLFGAEPANFLDVGGGATPEKVTEAFKIMLKNPKVEAILVNIFGGIMKCDTIATGVITACKAVNLSVPLVVRMKGTNEELGKKMLAESGLPIISADTMAEAAQKVVAAVKKPDSAAATAPSAAAPVAATATAETTQKPACCPVGGNAAAGASTCASKKKCNCFGLPWLVLAAAIILAAVLAVKALSPQAPAEIASPSDAVQDTAAAAPADAASADQGAQEDGRAESLAQ